MRKIILIAVFLILIVSSFNPAFAEETRVLVVPPPSPQAQAEADEAQLQKTLKQILPSEKELIEDARTSTNVSLPSGSFKYELVPAIIKIILGIAGVLAFIAFVVAGVMLVIAGGNEELIKKAKNVFLYSAIGLAVIATAYALVYGLSIMLTAK